MYRTHEFEFTPILIGGKKRYLLELPEQAKPIKYKTMTTDMRTWYGELDFIIKTSGSVTMATVQTAEGALIGRVIGPVALKGPCWVMEHLNVDGHMELLVASEKLLAGNINFINYGVPQGKHLRIDVYTGEYRIING